MRSQRTGPGSAGVRGPAGCREAKRSHDAGHKGAVSWGHHINSRPDHGPLLDGQQFDVEHQRSIGRNRRGASRGAVGDVCGDDEFSFSADLHAAEAEVFTSKSGEFTSLEETIRSFEEICDGRWDHLPEQAFLYVGVIEQADEQAKKMAEEA